MSATTLSKNEATREFALDTIVSNAIKLPGVKVDRQKFLATAFAKETDNIQRIINEGPIAAGVDEKTLRKTATTLILDRTAKSSLASFAMGIPGGTAMAATIPADIMQFYGMTLRLAQEISYLYGADNVWTNGEVNEEMVRDRLLLYCGVMFGVSGATSGVRVLSTQVAKVTLKKLPQKALTKTFWYPIVKSIGNSIGLHVTKASFAKGVSQAIPIIGGIVSGTITFASMKPMAEKLVNALEKANFHYSEEEFTNDIGIISSFDESQPDKPIEPQKKSLLDKRKEKLSTVFRKKEKTPRDEAEQLKK